MIDVSGHSLQLGLDWAQAPTWAEPLVRLNRRDAAFVDTGYLRALLDPRDGRHTIVRQHWSQTKVLAYTSSLVAAEVARQLAKAERVDQPWRWARVEAVKALLIDDGRIVVCSPTREAVYSAFHELVDMQRTLLRLDLCDALTLVVLDSMRHRRVLGFDNHLISMGASLEPG